MSRELLSDNGRFVAVQQDDGNFVLYEKPDDKVLWSMFSYRGEEVIDQPFTPPEPSEAFLSQIADDINPIGMAYWRNINNHSGKNHLYVVLSVHDELVLFKISKSDLTILERTNLGIHHTGEGVYFSAIEANLLYHAVRNDLKTLDVESGEIRSVWNSHYNLWQCHSSYDGRVHSASMQDDGWKIRYWGVHYNGEEKKYELEGDEPDECQVDKSGQFLLIKEDQDNRIIRLSNGSIIKITDNEGAVGHSDCGFGCAIGENDKSDKAGALDFIDLESGRKQNMFSTGIWNMGYASFCNARSGSLRDQYCLVTTPEKLIKVKLDGSGQGTDICSTFNQSTEYEHRPKANLCPLGQFAIWTAFANNKLNAYLVRL